MMLFLEQACGKPGGLHVGDPCSTAVVLNLFWPMDHLLKKYLMDHFYYADTS